ncbi:MAG TPA: pitrilysin family protein [Bacteroidales bacterium]|nr:pitrilysin family protein [Bacteroidales bacterium]HPP92448.1 pitrilysin family protein [Bacteroidales bacterium]HQG56067.1 pitrilysin family protein [Bacteroidales bacterium]HQK69688.1 pitrilysin family protein [Bacteroidales bacterium]HRR16731.1 pitrilysin family protein [Bacteroidales bacterium]
MIEIKRCCLNNGLRVIVHEDSSTPLAAVSLVYMVGSRNEDPELTGLAHLFEHLMFRGSESVPDFDDQLQLAGGENNAFTNSDITNYYLTIPAVNIETAFWLESDRMKGLNITEESLSNQKMVVLEEYRQAYLNQPYGDATLLIRPLAYKIHPYRWPTIGKEEHIKKVTLGDIKEFFHSYYAPNNCIMVVAGNVSADDVFRLAEKWFGKIKMRKVHTETLPEEPPQKSARKLTVKRNVPANALYKAWHVCCRRDPSFITLDLLTDILAAGESGRLQRILVREKKLFSSINAYLTGDLDPGLLIIQGRLNNGVSYEKAENELNKIIEEIKSTPVPDEEMEKVKNRFEAEHIMDRVNILGKVLSLSQYEVLGDASLINSEIELYRNVTAGMVSEAAGNYLKKTSCNTLYYISTAAKQL